MYRKTGHRAKVLGAIFVLPMGLIWTGGTALGQCAFGCRRPR